MAKKKVRKKVSKKTSIKRPRLVKKIEAVALKSFDKVVKRLVKRYGKVQVVFAERGYERNLRRRVIDKNGICTVSYKGNGYRKWSGFQKSCFFEDYTNPYEYSWDHGHRDLKKVKPTLNKTIKAMLEHDEDDGIVPTVIKYGKGLKKEIVVYDDGR